MTATAASSPMYSNVVLGIEHHHFEEALDEYKDRQGLYPRHRPDRRRLEDADRRATRRSSRQELGKPFPQDPQEQLWGAIGAVFGSWMNSRAIKYRELHAIPASWGTAVNVQAMVFGNMGETSATGVAFTRNPSTGEKELYGEFLINAQGEDVVAGIRTPQDITERARIASGSDKPSMERAMPEAYAELVRIYGILEKHYRDMQDMEFTVETRQALDAPDAQRQAHRQGGAAHRGRARQRRPDHAGRGGEPRRSGGARPAAASDHRSEGRAQDRGDRACPPRRARPAARSCSTPTMPKRPGRPAARSSWCASRRRPEDIHGMHAAEGILTTRGGMTSHAAVVARGMGKPCVSGAGSIRVDYAAQTLTVAGQVLKKGDVITIDGGSGQVLLGQVKMLEPELSGEFATLMGWADKVRRMKVRANAETPLDAKTARNFGAEGIGLCRTEHMFFEGDRIVAVREMILADDEKGRRAALAKLLPMQRADFAELFTIMSGLPVTIRLLDPPLHEFLPHTEEEMEEVAQAMKRRCDKLKRRAAELHEFNPMLGFRGVRLAIAYPEIAEMQARAIFEAAVEAGKRHRRAGRAGDHGAARHDQGRARPREGAHRRDGRGGGEGNRRHGRISGRHDDRTAARRAAGRRHRRDRPSSSRSAPTT